MQRELDFISAAAPRQRPSPRLVLRAFTLFPVIDLGLRRAGLEPTVERLLRTRPRRLPAQGADLDLLAVRTFTAVRTATLFYLRRRKDCLRKALATAWLLRRQGIPATICMAVKKFPFAAHSWVETASGTRLDDYPPRLAEYTVIHRISC
jgi:Transglutaminase-like superfamily